MAQNDVYVYGVLKGIPEDEMIRFASACAAIICPRFPSVRQPPGMGEIVELMISRKQEET